MQASRIPPGLRAASHALTGHCNSDPILQNGSSNFGSLDVSNTRIRVGILLENISLISDYIETQGDLTEICPCMGLIAGCRVCHQSQQEVPSDLEGLKSYLGERYSQVVNLNVIGKNVLKHQSANRHNFCHH